MSTSFLYQQQNTTQTDTIKQSDTTVSSTNIQKTFNQKNFTKKSLVKNKSILIEKIESGVDATSYIYSFSGKAIPLTDHFLNTAYFTDIKANNKKNNTSIKEKNLRQNNENKFTLGENDYLLIFIILLTGIIAFVRMNGKSYLQRTMSSMLSFSYSHRLYTERNKLFKINDLLLLFVFHLSFAAIFVAVLNYFDLPLDLDNKLFVYISFIGINYALIVGYKLFIRIIGQFISSGKAVSEYIFYVNSILIFLGILNVVFLFGILFAPEKGVNLLIYSLLIIYVIAYITRGLKIISVFLTNRFSLFYMILYFCALEIIPILLIAKYFVSV